MITTRSKRNVPFCRYVFLSLPTSPRYTKIRIGCPSVMHHGLSVIHPAIYCARLFLKSSRQLPTAKAFVSVGTFGPSVSKNLKLLIHEAAPSWPFYPGPPLVYIDPSGQTGTVIHPTWRPM